jgi:WD40 repeat protein
VAFSPDGKIFASGSSDQTIKLWDIATGAELRTLRGHTYSVLSVAFSPDGKLLASGSVDNMIKLWDVLTGQVRLTLPGHRNQVNSVVFSPDGQILASGSADGLVKLWNVSTGQELRTLVNKSERPRGPANHPPNVNSIAFSPDGKLLVSGGDEYTIKLWNVSTGEVLHSMKDHSYGVNAVAFGPDGQTVVSGSFQEITVWDAGTGQELRKLKGQSSYINAVKFSPDGKTLASANYTGTIKLWDMNRGAEIRTLTGHASEVSSVSFSPDGQTLVSGSSDGTIKLWTLGTGVVQRTFEGHSGGVFSAQFSRGGKTLFAGSTDRAVKLWDLSTKETLLRTLAPHASEFLSLIFSADGRLLVTTGAHDLVRLWDVSTGNELHKLTWLSVEGDSRGAKAFSPNGKILAGGDTDHHIELWDVASGAKLRTLKGHDNSIDSIAFSPDGKILASGSFKEVKLWDVASGSELHTLAGHANVVNAVVFSPDGKTLASDSTSELYLWDVATGAKLRTLKANGNDICTFSPDGKTIFSGTTRIVDGAMITGVTEWDVRSGVELRTFTGHSFGVIDIAFSPDAKTMATGSIDNTIRLWDLNTGKELRALYGHSGQVLSVAFSADGRLLTSSSDDMTVKIWAASSGQELATLIALDDQDWTVVTPDGLFDGSPGAWNRIIWRFGQSANDFVPIELFFNEFYYPGLLGEIMAGKRPTARKDISKLDRRQPTISIAQFSDASTGVTNEPRVTVRIEVAEEPADSNHTTGSGARDVRLFRNGSLVRVWHADVLKGQTSVTLEAAIPIVAGENRLTAYAFNHDNIKSSDVTLTVMGADSLKRKGTLHILAVGVSRYANRQYNLDYTTDDATSFASQLKLQQEKLGRSQSVEIETLLNESATKENILAELKKFADSVQPEDGVVVYFSGHGQADGDRFYLVPHDLGYSGPRDHLSAEGLRQVLTHSISDLELEDAFRDIDAGEFLMVIDACNSGQALENKDEPRRGPMNTRGLAQLAYEKGMYILTASQNVEEAFVSEKLKHSYLTYALVEDGLKTNAADADHNGEVTLREWFDYAVARVPKLREETLQRKSLEEVNPTLTAVRTRKSQTPRVFYRREREAQPWVVAKTAVTKQ